MSKIGTKYNVISAKDLKKPKQSKGYWRNEDRFSDYNIEWHDFDHETADKLWDLHIKDPTASQCREFILSYLGTEIEFKLNEETLDPEPNFERILKTEWSKFVREVFDAIFIMGVCPIKFVRSISSSEDYVPVVLQKHTYKLQVAFLIETESLLFRILRPCDLFFNAEKSTTLGDMDKNRHRPKDAHKEGLSFTFMSHFDIFQSGYNFKKSGYSMFKGNDHHKSIRNYYKRDVPGGWVLDRNSIVLHGFGYDPDINGQLTSRLRTILEYQEFTVFQGKIMITNQTRLLNTPLFMKSTEPADTSQRDGNTELNATHHRQEIKKRKELEAHKREMNMLSADYHNNTIAYLLATPQGPAKKVMHDSSEWGGAVSQMLSDDPGPPVSVVDLPKGYDLSTGQKRDVTLGMRFFDCEDKLEEKTCSSYGVLVDLIKNRGIHKSNSAAQSEFFQKTLLRWMVILQDILTACYTAIYGQKDHDHLIAEELEMVRLHKDLLGTIDDFIIDDWEEDDGNMTKLEKDQKKDTTDDDEEEDEEKNQEEFEYESEDTEDDKTKTKKRSRNDQEISPFDPSLQLKTSMKKKQKNQEKEHNQPFKKLKSPGNVIVSLSFNSALMIDLFAFLHASGALLDSEYWAALRHHVGYPVNDKTLKSLKKQMEEKIKLENPEPKAAAGAGGKSSAAKNKSKSSSSSSSSSYSKSKKKKEPEKPQEVINVLDNEATKSVLEEVVSAVTGHSGGVGGSRSEGAGRSKDVEKERKQKRATSQTKSKESNVKRSISARKHQALNAEQGKKNKKKSH